MRRRARRNWRVTPPRPQRTYVTTTEEAAFGRAKVWAKEFNRLIHVARMEPFNDWNVHPDGNVTVPWENENLDEAMETARRHGASEFRDRAIERRYQ